jgi:hypothetical protein
MSTGASNPIVKRGTFAYGETVRHAIEIYQTDFCPGSGDYEDPEEIREDKCGTFYNIRYLTGCGGKVLSWAPGFKPVENAMHYVETAACDVLWE